jgi:hypothetical protein
VTDLLVAVGVTAASMALMYLVCLRPMRRGYRSPAGTDPSRDEVARLRREVAALRDRAEAR